jgi:hypothetical protein
MVDDPNDHDAEFKNDPEPDQLLAARGIIVWVLISTIFFILIGFAVFVLRRMGW